jgi:putative phosphoribosyl transferase
MNGQRFQNRRAAGVRLADKLAAYRGDPDVIVLGLPRGGVPVAYEVARSLGAPLDVFAVRKLGVPGQRELAMGAVSSGGVRVLNPEVVNSLHISSDMIDQVVLDELRELERQERAYRGPLPFPALAGRTVIVVDDGLATGSTMRAAVRALRPASPAQFVVAVPVGAAETCRDLAHEADEVICCLTPQSFESVSAWYEEFEQTTDEEVRALLHAAASGR